jgi:hypothetical protein
VLSSKTDSTSEVLAVPIRNYGMLKATIFEMGRDAPAIKRNISEFTSQSRRKHYRVAVNMQSQRRPLGRQSPRGCKQPGRKPATPYVERVVE